MNIYLYRRLQFDRTQYPNPYIFQLEDTLSRHFTIVNRKDNTIGVLDVFRYFFKTKIFFFNWVEILPQVRFGKVQVVLFYLFLVVAKACNKKVVWTLHNKYTHATGKNSWTDFMYRILIKYADLILTHSAGGINFISSNYPGYSYKTSYIIHPVQEILPSFPPKEKKYDFLIWGGIQPYKGITEFLAFVKDHKDTKTLKILLVGKCFNEKYKQVLAEYYGEDVIHHDQFYTIEEISSMANESKFILFTYRSATILSSGSLMDSIRMRSVIIGPGDGAFKDLAADNFIYTYNNFEEVLDIHQNHSAGKKYTLNTTEEFCRQNTWEAFGDKLISELKRVHVSV